MCSCFLHGQHCIVVAGCVLCGQRKTTKNKTEHKNEPPEPELEPQQPQQTTAMVVPEWRRAKHFSNVRWDPFQPTQNRTEKDRLLGRLRLRLDFCLDFRPLDLFFLPPSAASVAVLHSPTPTRLGQSPTYGNTEPLCLFGFRSHCHHCCSQCSHHPPHSYPRRPSPPRCPPHHRHRHRHPHH